MKEEVALNFESVDSYQISITITDTSELSASCEFQVEVIDVNDAPTCPSDDVVLYIDENQSAGFSFESIDILDEDNDSLSFELTSFTDVWNVKNENNKPVIYSMYVMNDILMNYMYIYIYSLSYVYK